MGSTEYRDAKTLCRLSSSSWFIIARFLPTTAAFASSGKTIFVIDGSSTSPRAEATTEKI